MDIKSIKVALADDHSLFREGLRFIIDRMIGVELIHEANSGNELLNNFEIATPDVVLLDLEMPNGDGINTIKKIIESFPKVKILILTMHSEDRMISYLMELGAHGYLLKDIRRDELRIAIETVYKEGFYFTNQISRSLLEGLKSTKKKIPKFGMSIELSNREQEILELIAEELTTTEIGVRLFISERTVEGHRKNLLLKFDAKNTAGLIIKAVKDGFLKV
jgi:DNA-binding NarL/FixJ family response regulator